MGTLYAKSGGIGKRIAILVDGDLWIVIHLMIAGRLHWRGACASISARSALAAFEFPSGSLVLTEAGSKRRASLSIVRGAEALAALDPGGIDVMNTDLEKFRAALEGENQTLKRALTDPRALSGIGNAYSDEILHAAKLSPLALTQKLTNEEWKRLFAATQETLRAWTARLQADDEGRVSRTCNGFSRCHGRARPLRQTVSSLRSKNQAHPLCRQ